MRNIYEEEFSKLLGQYNGIKDTGRAACKAANAMRKVIMNQELMFVFKTLDEDFINQN